MAKQKKDLVKSVMDPEDDPLVASFERVEQEDEGNLTAHDLRIRLFLRYYVQNFSARSAAIQMGVPKDSAGVVGHRYLRHEKTQKLLREMLRDLKTETSILKQEALSMLVREANHDDGSPGAHGARVNALRQLTKILGMEQTTINQNTKNESPGILAVPLAGTPEQWSKLAAISQDALLQEKTDTTAHETPPNEDDEDPESVL